MTLATPLIDQDALVEALEDLGFARAAIEVHAEPVPLVGYEGRSRSVCAQVVIRRQHVGASSNDVGFERTPTGFRAHISDFDSSRFGSAWLAKLHARHDEHHRARLARLAAEARRREEERREEERRRLVESQRAAISEKARKLGYRVEEKREGDKIRLVLMKRVF
jgi:hypothetical protein